MAAFLADKQNRVDAKHERLLLLCKRETVRSRERDFQDPCSRRKIDRRWFKPKF
jgi:hypothetical protein